MIDHGTPSGIRVGVKAAIVRDSAMLLVDIKDDSGRHYNLPGGGVELGESLREALRREVLEETDAEVQVGRLLMLREYEPARAGERWGPVQKLTAVFECSLSDGSEPGEPSNPDTNQIGIRWVPIASLAQIALVPPSLAVELITALRTRGEMPLHFDN